MVILLPLGFDLSELKATPRFPSVSTSPATPIVEPKLGELSPNVLVVQPAIEPLKSDVTT